MSTPNLYHPKLENLNSFIPQMTSDTFQPPFYFGGSEVPAILVPSSHIIGSGIYKKSKPKIYTNLSEARQKIYYKK
jgi:hypothetical protein